MMSFSPRSLSCVSPIPAYEGVAESSMSECPKAFQTSRRFCKKYWCSLRTVSNMTVADEVSPSNLSLITRGSPAPAVASATTLRHSR